jgi:electron transfer flavoprotein alpha subunit
MARLRDQRGTDGFEAHTQRLADVLGAEFVCSRCIISKGALYTAS